MMDNGVPQGWSESPPQENVDIATLQSSEVAAKITTAHSHSKEGQQPNIVAVNLYLRIVNELSTNQEAIVVGPLFRLMSTKNDLRL